MSSDSLLDFGRQVLEREWRKPRTVSGSVFSPGMLPSDRFLHDLIELAGQHPARPAGELEPVIHRMLEESHFVDDNGDSVVLDACESIECEARLLCQVLEEVRSHALRLGLWSAEPLTPMMFG